MTNVSNNSNGHKRAILYARVSTDEQRESGYGLTSQFNDCVEYARRIGYQIVGDTSYKLNDGKLIASTDADATPAYIEDFTGFSRFDDRPTGKTVMAMLKEKRADAIIVARIDRIARDSLEARIAARTWLKAGVELHAAKNGRITNDNDIVFLIETWQGQEDYTKIIKNLRDGRHNKAKGGRVVGCNRAPFGYRFTRDAKGKIAGFEIYESEARIVRLIYWWYVHGDEHGEPLTLFAIAARLSQMGILSPRQNGKRVCAPTTWRADVISRIIANETYVGTWHYRKVDRRGGRVYHRDAAERIAVNVPALIDRELWERAQARREYNAKMSKRNCKHGYLLRGRVRCGCGGAMVGYHGCANSKEYFYYICGVKSKRVEHFSHCEQRQVRCERLDNLVWDCVKELFASPDRLWSELKRAQQAELTEQDPKRAEIETVEHFIQQAETEINEIAVALRKASGRVGESLKKQMDDANARYDGYIARRAEIQKELGARKLTDDALQDIVAFAKDARAGIDQADFATKQRVLELLDVRVKVDGDKAQVSCVIASSTSWITSSRKPSAK
jgi:site-specific DNA recombinase